MQRKKRASCEGTAARGWGAEIYKAGTGAGDEETQTRQTWRGTGSCHHPPQEAGSRAASELRVSIKRRKRRGDGYVVGVRTEEMQTEGQEKEEGMRGRRPTSFRCLSRRRK